MITVEITIPKNRPESNVYKQTFDLGVNTKILKGIEILIPEGHKALAGIRIFTPGFPIIPASGSSVRFLRGENKTYTATINRKLEGPPFNIYCEGFNNDPFLDHSFIITFEV